MALALSDVRSGAAYIRNAIEACLGLLRGDRDAVDRLDLTADGYWTSFGAALIAAPFWVLQAFAVRAMTIEIDAMEEHVFAVAPLNVWSVLFAVVGYGLHWAAMPVAMAYVAKSYELQPRYVGFVVSYNWLGALTAAIMAPPFLLYALGLASVWVAVPLSFVCSAAVLAIRWRAALETLRISRWGATAIVALDVALSLFVVNVTAGLVLRYA